MEEGKIVAKASPREIFNQVETLKSIGLDVPQVTELAHQLRKEGIKIEGDPLSIEEMVEAICR
jgi:energy-coupling factor transport system ATP-binding protein